MKLEEKPVLEAYSTAIDSTLRPAAVSRSSPSSQSARNGFLANARDTSQPRAISVCMPDFEASTILPTLA